MRSTKKNLTQLFLVPLPAVVGSVLSTNPGTQKVVARVTLLGTDGLQKTYEAFLVGADRTKDLAVLKVRPNPRNSCCLTHDPLVSRLGQYPHGQDTDFVLKLWNACFEVSSLSSCGARCGAH